MGHMVICGPTMGHKWVNHGLYMGHKGLISVNRRSCGSYMAIHGSTMDHMWVNHGSCGSYLGHTWGVHGLCGSYIGKSWVTWVNHGLYMGHKGLISVNRRSCGSYMAVGQPWIMWAMYGVMYWSTMGRVGHTKQTLAIAAHYPFEMGALSSGGPGMATDTVVKYQYRIDIAIIGKITYCCSSKMKI